MQFSNYSRSFRVPFVVYADFESFITPINTCSPNPDASYTKKYQKHTPSSFCYYIKCFNDSIKFNKSINMNKLVTFTASGETDDVVKQMMW